MNARAMAYDLRAYADWCIAHYEDVPPTIVNDLNAAAVMIEQMEVELAAMRTAARSLKMALDKQNQRSRWIPVTEQLPEPETKVLVLDRHGHMMVRTMRQLPTDKTPVFRPNGLMPGEHVTHWMPLPEAPTEGENA